jgi:hypothetical protein
MDIRGSFYCNLSIIDQLYKFINGYPSEILSSDDSKLEPLLSTKEKNSLEPPGIKKMNFVQLYDKHPLT